jgi:hypothetical protein
MIFLKIFLDFFCFFFFKKGHQARPSYCHLGRAKTGPAKSLINYSAAACRNEFCMQQPQRREEEVPWRGGLGRDEVVRPVAQEASAEMTVAEVDCGRKKRWLFQAWEWPSCGWASYLWWRNWLGLWLVVGTVEREREGEKKLQKRGKKAVFLRL